MRKRTFRGREGNLAYVRLRDQKGLEERMGFTTYENVTDPHLTIHRDGCGQIMKRGGVHKYGQGRYEYHETYTKARVYAEATRLPIKDCFFCNPHD